MPKQMKIYFCGSISGSRSHLEFYYKFMDYLKKYGTVLTEPAIKGADWIEGPPDKERMREIAERDVSWMKESEVVIADVSIPSTGVGYELGIAESMGKKILCIHMPKTGNRLTSMIGGNKNMTIKEYSTVDEALMEIDSFMKHANDA